MSAAVGRRVAGALVWTVALGGLLHGLDRFALGPREVGWQAVASVDALPPEVGRLEVPGYLPERLAWPPTAVLARAGDTPGWWIGLGPIEAPPRLWIGTGADPLPEALGAVRGCLSDAPAARCPAGWRALSAPRGARTLWVVGRVDALTLQRILRSLDTRG